MTLPSYKPWRRPGYQEVLHGMYATCRRKGERILHFHLLKVTTVLKKWPEMGWHKRVVGPDGKALKMTSDPDLSECFQRHKNGYQ